MLHSKRYILLVSVFVFYGLGAVYIYTSLGENKWGKGSDLEDGTSEYPELHVERLPPRYLDEEVKKVLLWTSFYNDKELENYCIKPNTLDKCPYTKCQFTVDKGEIDSSNAVVFHGRDLKGDRRIRGSTDTYIEFPQYRYDDQLWIFLMFEAPIHTWINLDPLNSLFNMTMTYRPDSDIYIPYGRVVPLETAGHLPRLPSLLANSTEKPGLVAWSVSNCYKTPSRRNEVVHELQRYIPVDIYGDCGSHSCTPYTSLCTSVQECHQFLSKKYKFYLAFENSLCESYITEKFFNSLYFGMVPVVYGYGDYSAVAPKGSYIDATAFPTMKSLAMYLLYLDKHPLEYRKYFKWREQYTVSIDYFNDAWCALCTKLWTLDGESATKMAATTYNEDSSLIPRDNYVVKNLTAWWIYKSGVDSDPGGVDGSVASACLNPLQLHWDHNMFSFYSFIYYPNYSVRIGCVLAFSFVICCIMGYILATFWRRSRYRSKVLHEDMCK